jgi:hypothetical protein
VPTDTSEAAKTVCFYRSQELCCILVCSSYPIT